MGEFNSDDHYMYWCGQESLRRNGAAIMVNERVRNAVLGCILEKDRMISVRLQRKPFNITVIQAYAPTSNAEEAEVERFNGHMWFLNIRTEECACSLYQRFCFCFVQILYTSEQIKLINSFLYPFLKFFLSQKENMTMHFTP